MRHSPAPEYEVVWLNIPVDDFTAVDVLHHVEHADSKGQHQSLRHHLLRGVLIEVDGILETTESGILSRLHSFSDIPS